MGSFLSILPICFSVFASSSNAVKLEADSDKINQAISNVSSTILSSDSEALEDDLKNNIISFYDETNYASPYVMRRLKNYLKEHDNRYKIEENISLTNESSRIALSYDTDIPISNNIQNLGELEVNTDDFGIYYESTRSDAPFVGINIDKETCKAIYNFIYEVCTNYDYGKELLTTIKACASVSLATFVIKTEVKINKTINKLLMLIPPDGIGFTIKLAIKIVGISLGLFLSIVIFFALMDKGFYIGFLATSYWIWEWKFVCGIYE